MTTYFRFGVRFLVTFMTMLTGITAAPSWGDTNQDYVDHIRFYERELEGKDLQLRVLEDGASADEVFGELKLLESAVFDGAKVKAGSLLHLSCIRAECGGPGCPACTK